MSRCHWQWLIANAVYLLHVALLGSVLGAWADQGQSTIQIALTLAIKALYTQ
jgi:MFS-type transporter involved in bile tolerance (Atg22 family)